MTGASHCDELYKKRPSKDEIYSKLKIDPDKKILLFFACLHYHNLPLKWKERNWSILNKVVTFITKNNDYQLVVKHHPVDMNHYADPYSLYPKNTIIIANKLEKTWDNVTAIDVNEVVGVAQAAISTASSVLFVPMIKNVPVI
ncbi:MAG: hypothetical protein GY757_04120, partial [bacterium]|nr:hypothetical protein [bacterium]